MKQNFPTKIIALLAITFSLQLRASNSELPPSSASIFTNTLYYLYQPIAILFPHPEVRKILYETQTQYFYIRVEEDEQNYRHLVFLPDKGSQSVYDPGNPNKIVSNYAKYGLLSLLALKKSPQRILFIGMGGGIMPTYLRGHFPNAKFDIVEIDKDIPPIAEKYFNFNKNDSKTKIFIEDGRVFVNKSTRKYDLIFLDVYNAEGIPFQFTTVEFFQRLKKLLKNDGALSINLANFGKEKFIAGELNTIFDVFPNTFVFSSPGNTNYIPIALINLHINFSDLTKNALKINSTHKFNVNFIALLKYKLNKSELDKLRQSSHLIFKDDFAPVN